MLYRFSVIRECSSEPLYLTTRPSVTCELSILNTIEQ